MSRRHHKRRNKHSHRHHEKSLHHYKKDNFFGKSMKNKYAGVTSSSYNWTFSPAIFQQQLKYKTSLPKMSPIIKLKFARAYFPYPNYA